MPQRTVHGERIGADPRLEPLRQHDLIDFARGYALFGRTDLLLETLACVIGANLEAVPARGRGTRETALELALEEPDFRAGKLIERLEVVVRGDARVRNDENAVLHVIEREHGIEEHEAGLVRPVTAGAQVAQNGLKPRRSAVPEVADGAAREARQVGNKR